MALVTIKTFNTSTDAHIFMAKLENEGIQCFLFDENTITVNPMLNYSMGGIKLKINEKDLPLAKEIYKAFNEAPYTDDSGKIIRCPKCNSTEINSGISHGKGWRESLTMVVLLLVSIVPFYDRSGYQCKSCDNKFMN